MQIVAAWLEVCNNIVIVYRQFLWGRSELCDDGGGMLAISTGAKRIVD